jgi:iron-sulfur cluster assembly protein
MRPASPSTCGKEDAMASAQPRPRPQIMKLTDAAAARVREIMANAEKPVVGLRIGVKNGGCAGMEYTMEWAEDQKPFDEVVEDKGVKVLIDAKAMMFLLGTEMDFQQNVLKSGFVFNNPNQVSACGCGESVQLKAAEAS